jgi:hypothetical protein
LIEGGSYGTILGVEITDPLSFILFFLLFYLLGFLCFFVYFRYHKTGKIPEGKTYLYDEDNPEEYAESTKYKYKTEKKDEARSYVFMGVLLLTIGVLISYADYSRLGYLFIWIIFNIIYSLFLISFFYWYMKIKK